VELGVDCLDMSSPGAAKTPITLEIVTIIEAKETMIEIGNCRWKN
jgi:hypothetical protein